MTCSTVGLNIFASDQQSYHKWIVISSVVFERTGSLRSKVGGFASDRQSHHKCMIGSRILLKNITI